MFCHLQPSPYDRKKSMFLCSFSQPAVLGEVVSLVCFLWHSPLSINSLYMSSALALSGEEGHYGPSSVPAPRGSVWARLPGQAEWAGSLAQSAPFPAKASPATNGGGGVLCFFPSFLPTPCSRVSALPLLPSLTSASDNPWNLYP